MDTLLSSIKVFLLWLLYTIMFNSVMCSLKFHCNEKDMNTLLHFKQGVKDPSGLLSSWMTEQDCCEWTGVKCDNITGRVTQLNLPCHTDHSILEGMLNKSQCLTGEFNLSLLELEYLSYLNFSNNDFKAIQYNSTGNHKCDGLSRGTPPHICKNSSKLHYLDLSYNYDILIDNLHWISHLPSLQYLNLGGIDLHKAIDWLQSVTKLPSLSELHLESCQLENIYPSLQYANFTSLQVLNLADNDFTSELLPCWLFNLSCDISHIDLSQNQIHGQLSKIFSNHRSIKSLDLSENYLKGSIPNWIGELKQLQQLHLSENFFLGPIPTSLGNLSSLIVLSLYSNQLNGNLPESLGQLFNLEVLEVDDNPLTGTVSERNLHSLSNLKYLFLRSPALILDFDPEWVPPFQLEAIELGYVSDKLPSWLFAQSSLKQLVIADSSASFEPLDRFWNFAAKIEHLSLTNNTIGGDMSNVLLNSTFAWFPYNNLRGGLPQLSPQVSLLNLYSNSLSGSISSLLCHKMKDKSKLKFLELGNNLLSGELTNCWTNWKSLVHVGLMNNNLTGKIPHSMGFLSNLLSLDLYDNMLLGEIPFSLKNCSNLLILDLAENNFSGSIPRWMWQSVQVLLLRSNQFIGDIPTEICQLSSLLMMDFANNKLSGPIPHCFHNITALHGHASSHYFISISIQLTSYSQSIEFKFPMFLKGNKYINPNLMNVIDLSDNSLSGSVPLEMFTLIKLQSLNLSHNQLVGTIPEEIGNLKQLESIDLSNNHFSGEIPQSMSDLNFLGVLNLSFNNFMGKIPSGTQLQGFTYLSYLGNLQLCGPPLTKVCPQDENSHNTEQMRKDDDDDDKYEVYSWFYMGLGIGFAVGFLVVLGVIFFNRTCRHAYFRFLNQLHAMVVQKMFSFY